MGKKDYLSPNMEVNILNGEDIITTSIFITESEDGSQTTVGGFVGGWLDD